MSGRPAHSPSATMWALARCSSACMLLIRRRKTLRDC
jgi:hypothetical protein